MGWPEMMEMKRKEIDKTEVRNWADQFASWSVAWSICQRADWMVLLLKTGPIGSREKEAKNVRRFVCWVARETMKVCEDPTLTPVVNCAEKYIEFDFYEHGIGSKCAEMSQEMVRHSNIAACATEHEFTIKDAVARTAYAAAAAAFANDCHSAASVLLAANDALDAAIDAIKWSFWAVEKKRGHDAAVEFRQHAAEHLREMISTPW